MTQQEQQQQKQQLVPQQQIRGWSSTLFVDWSPCLSFESSHKEWMISLVELSDGSLVSCSHDSTAKRWLLTMSDNDRNDNDSGNDRKGITAKSRLLGSFVGHGYFVSGVVEKDSNTLVTASGDGSLKVWNIETGACLVTAQDCFAMCSLMKTKDNTRIVCGFWNGGTGLVRLDDISPTALFRVHDSSVNWICELEDGSFVSASCDTTLKRWNQTGEVFQTYSGHSKDVIRVIELRRDVIVSASEDETLKMWKVSTGECLRTFIGHSGGVRGLIKLSTDVFVSGSIDETIRVWGEKGECLETIQTGSMIGTMTRLRNGSIITSNSLMQIEIRRVYVLCIFCVH